MLRVLTADGIRIFSKGGNSYYHSFSINIFGKPVVCRDTFDSIPSLINSSINFIGTELEYVSFFIKFLIVIIKLNNQIIILSYFSNKKIKKYFLRCLLIQMMHYFVDQL